MKHIASILASNMSSVIPPQLTSKTSTILRYIAVGIAIRFFLMPLLSGPDLTTTAWISFTLIQKHQLIFSSDPPAVFFLLAGFYRLILPLFPSGVIAYITSQVGYTPPPFQIFALLQPNIHSFLFLAKIPFLLFDLFSAFLILHLFSDGTKSLLAFKIWLVNPIVIAITYVYGQYDVIAVFFIIMALYFLKNKKYGWTMFAVGIAGTFKIFGLAFLPLAALSFWKNQNKHSQKLKITKTAGLFIIGLLPALSIPIIFMRIPQFYESVNYALPRGTLFNGFFGETFYSQGVAGQPLYSGLVNFLVNFSASIQTHISIPDFVYFIPFAYTLVLLGAIFERRLPYEKTYKYFTVFLLAYYAFSLFYPQWFLWVQPFLILLVAENPKTYRSLFGLSVPLFFLYTLQTDNVLTSIVLTPIIPKALVWPGVSSIMASVGLPAMQLIGVFRTILSAICIFTAIYVSITSFYDRGKTSAKLEIAQPV